MSERATWEASHSLTDDQVERYSRHLLMEDIGVKGQEALIAAKVLVVGAGGLGSSALLYLAAAGVGTIGVVDGDVVDRSNLQRQIIHRDDSTGMKKVRSAAAAIAALNPGVKVETVEEHLNASNALELVKGYDLLMDCTDNAATRYLCNDAAIITGKPLISGAAIGLHGQITMYGDGGPCYRCIHPVPAPPESRPACGDSGVLGAVPGTIGAMQAAEAVKWIVGGQLRAEGVLRGRMIIWDVGAGTARTVRMRPKQDSCAVCGTNPSITEDSLPEYETWCGADGAPAKEDVARVSPSGVDLSSSMILDVRSKEQFAIGALKGAVNVPWRAMKNARDRDGDEGLLALVSSALGQDRDDRPVYVVCRRGNDSQRALAALQAAGWRRGKADVVGGMTAWRSQVDATYPKY